MSETGSPSGMVGNGEELALDGSLGYRAPIFLSCCDCSLSPYFLVLEIVGRDTFFFSPSLEVFRTGAPFLSLSFSDFFLLSSLLSLSSLPTPGLSHLPLGLTRSLPSTSGQLAPAMRCTRAVPGPR